MPRPRKVRLIIGAPRNYATRERDKVSISAIASELRSAVKQLGENHDTRRTDDEDLRRHGAVLSLVDPGKPSDKALLLFHRGHEHSGRWQEFIDLLALENVAIFAWDQRGHGRSHGACGGAENFAVITKDVETFVRHVSGEHKIALENMIVLAHSMGAVSSPHGCTITRRRSARWCWRRLHSACGFMCLSRCQRCD